MISRALIDDHARNINNIAASASRATSALYAAGFDHEVASVVSHHRNAAAVAASDFYDGIRVAQMGSAARSRHSVGDTPNFLTGSAEYFVDEYLSSQANKARAADWLTRNAVNETLTFKSRTDDNRPRFALVPTGARTCEFCIMLASRGFVYRSDGTASASQHANCDCAIVPSWEKSPRVEKYDPDAYYQQYATARDGVSPRRFSESRRDYERRLMAEMRNVAQATSADIAVGRSVGAAARNVSVRIPETGEFMRVVEGSKIAGVRCIAGKGNSRKVDIRKHLSSKYGGKEADWQKMRGSANIDYAGLSRRAEIHWFYNEASGRHVFFDGVEHKLVKYL